MYGGKCIVWNNIYRIYARKVMLHCYMWGKCIAVRICSRRTAILIFCQYRAALPLLSQSKFHFYTPESSAVFHSTHPPSPVRFSGTEPGFRAGPVQPCSGALKLSTSNRTHREDLSPTELHRTGPTSARGARAAKQKTKQNKLSKTNKAKPKE